MELNLDKKLSEDEQQELQRRVLAVMEQMYLEGISTGRELSRETLNPETEGYINNKIAFLTNYFIKEEVWKNNPPPGYNANKVIPKIQPTGEDSDDYAKLDKKIKMSESSGEGLKELDVNNEMSDDGGMYDQKPEWAKAEEKPEWLKEKKPFK